MEQQQLTELRVVLAKRFDESELRTLCFDLGISYDDLSGWNKSDKARELVDYLTRRNFITKLIHLGKIQRPDIPWDRFSKETQREFTASTTRVTILIDREVHKFTSVEQDHFVFALSRLLNINPDEIRVLQVIAGSVLITIEIPEGAAHNLITSYLRGDSKLAALSIKRIEFTQLNNDPKDIVFVNEKDTETDKSMHVWSDYYNEKGREKYREWAAKGEWDWYLLAHAIQYYLKSIDYEPSNQHPWINLAYVYFVSGNKQIASEYLQRGLELAKPGPNYPGRHYSEVEKAIKTNRSITGQMIRPPAMPDWFHKAYILDRI